MAHKTMYIFILFYLFPAFLFSTTVYDSALGYWKLDETSGLTAYDSRAHYNGSLVNISSGWTDGIVGNALTFDGSDDYVDMSTITLGSQSITTSAWVKASEASDEIVCYGQGDVIGSFIMRLSYNYFQIWISNGSNAMLLTSSIYIPLGEWHHVVGTAQGNTIRLYVDGVLDKTWSSTLTGYQVANSERFTLGRTINRTRFFDGTVDEVAIWNRALDATEVSSLYVMGVPEFSSLFFLSIASTLTLFLYRLKLKK